MARKEISTVVHSIRQGSGNTMQINHDYLTPP